jgi:hypothetical protein
MSFQFPKIITGMPEISCFKSHILIMNFILIFNLLFSDQFRSKRSRKSLNCCCNLLIYDNYSYNFSKISRSYMELSLEYSHSIKEVELGCYHVICGGEIEISASQGISRKLRRSSCRRRCLLDYD